MGQTLVSLHGPTTNRKSSSLAFWQEGKYSPRANFYHPASPDLCSASPATLNMLHAHAPYAPLHKALGLRGPPGF